ncbi:DNA internalization-related competence protein ComEC/Rec2 [Vibrio algarum]|uniref:DNA internalization-related competence protein ComEC/Rec2 n=1 Tax=Vibrio algarum TaxID=3020714 RepID=A0ABT4YPU8_9VIBR|nr:DNA internalization-related competence protein ComEC/Rec2 [Vibrio sp. KJ40-1]MDB1123571.1 DNA internalization-related competence protein ComEC/Rec2 [Vibrio sp. KJ40-1]
MLEPIYWAIQFSSDSWINIDRINLLQVFALVVFMFLRPLLKREQQIIVGLSVLFIIQTVDIHPNSSWQVSILDVGHGLAVLIRKGNQHILYDTGVKWETGSMAEMVIAPVLRYRGVDDVGLLILSHSDSDHAGGREYIEQHFTPISKLSSQRISGYSPCVDKTMLNWNGLTLSAVWPPKLVKRAYNPHSCVIRVTDGVSSILLTGDIEAIGELLLAKKGDEIRSDILLVPHHGSRSSSTDYFLNAVDPKVAIASVAKGNQWDLPSEIVVNKYMTRNIKWLDTGSDGQISIDFSRNGWQIMNIRNRQSLSWYRKILRKGVE